MSQENKIQKNLYKFLFEQKASLSHAQNKLGHDSNKINPDTILMKNAMAQWISAVDRKELIIKLKTFLLTYPSIESLNITGSWEYRRTIEDSTAYTYTPNFNIYFYNDDEKGLSPEDLEDELIYDLDLFDNFSDYEMEGVIANLKDISLKNIDSLFDLITDKEDMDAFLAVENYEKNEIQNALSEVPPPIDNASKKQKI